MQINLEAHLESLAKPINSFDQVFRAVSVDSMGQRVFTNVEPKLDENILELMLLGVRPDNVIVIEDKNGDYEVVRGHEQVATAQFIYANRADCTPHHLIRRLMRYEMQMVIYRTTMDRDDVARLIQFQYDIEI